MHALRLFRALSTAQHDQDLVFFIYAAVASSLVVLAGLMSGLTLGLLSLNSLDLELLKRSGTEQEKRYAERIAPVLKRPHFLLVTLVLCNAAATEALPIILDRLADPITAVLVSVVVVLIFGEIIPQAVCSRYGLVIGAYSAWFVRGLMWITCIVSYPISLILDKVLGEQHSALFRRAQLKALVDIHGHHEGLGGNLSTDEINIIRGALDMTNKTADQCMTPLDKVFMLSASDLVDEETLGRILDSGHSRIPVHTPGNRRAILGLILVKELIMVDKSQGLLVRDLHIRALPCLRSDTALYDMLKLFETGRCHMAVLEAPSEADICRRHSSVVEQQMENMLQVRVDEATSAKVEQGEFCPPEDASTGASIAADCSSENTPLLAASPVASGAKTPRLDGSAQDNRQPVGIVTIEDIIEELIQQEIVDETDRFVDNEHLQRVNAALLLQGLPDRLRMLLRSPAFMPRGPERDTAAPATLAPPQQ
ncbi:hypothetical protein WJX72_005166 [[Myrmecia] bisecta]|uniref:CNNM transmembrane domain-containing protein n=1 Tax=[Myrmecia] bisecta TaxID=41462 RepID=A0AAW1QF43_9CHLO